MALAGVGACGTPHDPVGSVDTGTRTLPTASRDPKIEEASRSALAAYAGYVEASRTAEQSGDPLDPQLRRYLADPLLTRVRVAIRATRDHGATRTGRLVSDPTVTAVNLDTVPATVSIQDCLDASGYRLVYRKDGSRVPGSANGRYVATATATRFPDGRWLINAGSAHGDQPC